MIMKREEEIKMSACSHWSNAPYKEEVERGCISETAMARKVALRAFTAGAEWADAHPKDQWIDTRECKGSDTSADCILILEGGSVTRGYYNDDKGWLEYPDYNNVLDDVCYWMDCDLFKD